MVIRENFCDKCWEHHDQESRMILALFNPQELSAITRGLIREMKVTCKEGANQVDPENKSAITALMKFSIHPTEPEATDGIFNEHKENGFTFLQLGCEHVVNKK